MDTEDKIILTFIAGPILLVAVMVLLAGPSEADKRRAHEITMTKIRCEAPEGKKDE